jgi:hypothetical protein
MRACWLKRSRDDVLENAEAAAAVGQLHWYRFLLLPKPDNRHDLDEALGLLLGNEVTRPGVMEDLMAAVTRPGADAVGMTTGLWDAGGFGKTMMARLLVHCQEVREQFLDGMLWVTVGEDTTEPELAEKVTNVVSLLRGVRPPLTDPLAVGAELGRVLRYSRCATRAWSGRGLAR